MAGSINSYEGVSVALSADGGTLAVGAPNFNSQGATKIYTKHANTWYPKASLSMQIANSNEGSSVSLSANGNTLAVGAPGANGTSIGQTHIYVRSGTQYRYQPMEVLLQREHLIPPGLSRSAQLSFMDETELIGNIKLPSLKKLLIPMKEVQYHLLVMVHLTFAAGAPAYQQYTGLTNVYIN